MAIPSHASSRRVGVGLIGSPFITATHAEADANHMPAAGGKLMYAEVLRPQVCAHEAAARRGRPPPPDPSQAVGEARRPDAPHFGTWSALGGVTMDVGCYRHRVLPLDAAPAPDQIRQCSDEQERPRRPHTRRRQRAIFILEFEGGAVAVAEESWTTSAGWASARRFTARSAWPSPTSSMATPSRHTVPRATAMRWSRPARPRAAASTSTRRLGTTAFAERWPCRGLRPERPEAAGGRTGWARGPRGDLRRLRVYADGTRSGHASRARPENRSICGGPQVRATSSEPIGRAP